ncbi:NrdH-redoxin [Corynebacterium hindlerae]|uniref:NrdH-redoxin n=1 Tax=Corynebacterium hindlerae TaxID=699041 RepID=A0A7G5FGT9_9CORY|nr:glutaredoxin domain-containing protein [Corynebacterium hindlerae]QMV85830.1 NrdH-redoxin [Corynebacterium hindlerae]
MADFKIYTTEWCPFCQKLVAALDEANIPYTRIDVEEDAEAAAWVESVNGGDRIVPTVVYPDSSHATNPQPKVAVRKYTRLTS